MKPSFVMSHRPFVMAAGVLALLLAAGTAAAAESAPDYMDEARLRQMLVDHTVSGRMASGSDYGEYYAPGGQVLAKSYTGEWEINDDRFCLDYGEGPTCYGVVLDGMNIQWYRDGDLVGRGTLQPGNPMNLEGEADSTDDSAG